MASTNYFIDSLAKGVEAGAIMQESRIKREDRDQAGDVTTAMAELQGHDAVLAGTTAGIRGYTDLTPEIVQSWRASGKDFGAFGIPEGGNHGAQSAADFGIQAPASLIGSESGGDWGATNDAVGHGGAVGHFGRLQFGQARLADAVKAGVIQPHEAIADYFTQNRGAQEKVENWHFNDIWSHAKKNGYDQLVGKASINGVPVTRDGLLAVAHLGGKKGMDQFIQSAGQYDPADANGTTLSKYLAQHATRTA